MSQRNSVREVLWVVGIFGMAFAFLYFSSKPTIFTNDYIEYGDSGNPIYLRPWFILLFTFFILLLITYFIKEALTKFSDIAGNIILSLAIIGNIITISIFINILSFMESDWIAYPTLSTIPQAGNPSRDLKSILFPILITIQFLLIASLLMIGIRIGFLSKHRPTATPGWRG